jgi:hypothetical protein
MSQHNISPLWGLARCVFGCYRHYTPTGLERESHTGQRRLLISPKSEWFPTRQNH